MKNITVSLPDEAHRQARIKAAERATSVSALVREFLISLGDEESDFARRKRLQDEVLGTVRTFSHARANPSVRGARAIAARRPKP